MQNSKTEAILENAASIKIKYLIFHGMRTVDTEIYALIKMLAYIYIYTYVCVCDCVCIHTKVTTRRNKKKQ